MPFPAGARRREYTAADDDALRKWVAEHPRYPDQGNILWQAAEARNITQHPWQSMRQRWRMQLKPRPPVAWSAAAGAAAGGPAAAEAQPRAADVPAPRVPSLPAAAPAASSVGLASPSASSAAAAPRQVVSPGAVSAWQIGSLSRLLLQMSHWQVPSCPQRKRRAVEGPGGNMPPAKRRSLGDDSENPMPEHLLGVEVRHRSKRVEDEARASRALETVVSKGDGTMSLSAALFMRDISDSREAKCDSTLLDSPEPEGRARRSIIMVHSERSSFGGAGDHTLSETPEPEARARRSIVMLQSERSSSGRTGDSTLLDTPEPEGRRRTSIIMVHSERSSVSGAGDHTLPQTPEPEARARRSIIVVHSESERSSVGSTVPGIPEPEARARRSIIVVHSERSSLGSAGPMGTTRADEVRSDAAQPEEGEYQMYPWVEAEEVPENSIPEDTLALLMTLGEDSGAHEEEDDLCNVAGHGQDTERDREVYGRAAHRRKTTALRLHFQTLLHDELLEANAGENEQVEEGVPAAQDFPCGRGTSVSFADVDTLMDMVHEGASTPDIMKLVNKSSHSGSMRRSNRSGVRTGQPVWTRPFGYLV